MYLSNFTKYFWFPLSALIAVMLLDAAATAYADRWIRRNDLDALRDAARMAPDFGNRAAHYLEYCRRETIASLFRYQVCFIPQRTSINGSPPEIGRFTYVYFAPKRFLGIFTPRSFDDYYFNATVRAEKIGYLDRDGRYRAISLDPDNYLP
jgi:hypothetical protein